MRIININNFILIIKGESYSDKADIYSLGVTFYFMFYKKYPYGEGIYIIFMKKINLSL